MNKTLITKDTASNTLKIIRAFNAPRELVWRTWTEQELLDQWWAPEPWKTETKTLEFKEGGHWLYSMNGPEGEKHWSGADYKKIIPFQLFECEDYFCDEKGIKSPDFSAIQWKVRFTKAGTGTEVEVDISFDSADDMNKIIEMGFKEGFTAAHGNLDELLKTLTSQSRTS